MQAQTRSAELDDATLAFAEHVFHAARIGDSVRLGHLLGQGMRLHEIARALGRDDRTVWTIQARAKRKSGGASGGGSRG